MTKKLDCASRVTSSLHAIFVSVGVLFFLSSHGMTYHPNNGRSPELNYVWVVSIGYSVFDLISMGRRWKYFGVSFLIHHLVMIIAELYELIYNYNTWAASLLLLSEISTPFLNMRWWLFTFGLHEGRLYFINGILLYLFFLFGRVLPAYLCIFIHCWSIYLYRSEMDQKELYIYTFLVSFFVLLNTYWFILLTNKTLGVLKDALGPKKKEGQERKKEL